MNKENITNLRLWLKEDLPYREKHNLECALAIIEELERENQELKENKTSFHICPNCAWVWRLGAVKMKKIKGEKKMKEKIKKLIELCTFYNLDLQIRYYGDSQICFSGIYENDDEIFMVSIYYCKNKRLFYIKLNSQLEQYRNNGNFSKEEMLLLLSLDDLTDDELGIKPQGVETK